MDRRTMLGALSGFTISSIARQSRAAADPSADGNLVSAIHDASDNRVPEMLKTPLYRSDGLSKLFKSEVFLKCEHLQTTGSFKYRGASNSIRLLDAPRRRRGVVTASSGNHGLAVALAGRHAGVSVTVYAPSTASSAKLDAIRSYGASLELVDDGVTDGETKHSKAGRSAANRTGRTFISPYNDLNVIAGQGTIGLEILSEVPKTDLVFLSVGGGGLAGEWEPHWSPALPRPNLSAAGLITRRRFCERLRQGRFMMFLRGRRSRMEPRAGWSPAP